MTTDDTADRPRPDRPTRRPGRVVALATLALAVGAIGAAPIAGAAPTHSATASPAAAHSAPVRPATTDPATAPIDDTAATERPAGAEASLRADAAIIAAAEGWSMAATVAHLRTQHEFGALVDRMIEHFPTRFAAAEFASEPGAGSTLWFTGPVPLGVRQMVEASGLDVRSISGAPWNERELAERVEDVAAFFVERGDHQVTVAAGPDGSIDVAVRTDRITVLPPELRDGVRVHRADGDVTTPEHTYGGLEISGVTECTTGFSVRHTPTGRTGVVTAGHCLGVNTYHPRSGSTYSTTWQDQHVGLSGDVEWHTTPHGEFAQYYADAAGQPSNFRDVDTVETSTAVNNWYCIWSRKRSRRTCDQVYSTIAAAGLVANLIMMDDDNTDSGDSGGPWSWSTEAVGVHQGDVWLFRNRNVWSKVWALDTALDVEVVTCANHQC